MTDAALIIGRARIAHVLGRSEKTITRWVTRGILPTVKTGPFENSILAVRVQDVMDLAPALVMERD